MVYPTSAKVTIAAADNIDRPTTRAKGSAGPSSRYVRPTATADIMAPASTPSATAKYCCHVSGTAWTTVTTSAAVPVSTVMKDRLTATLRQLSRRMRKTRSPAATCVRPTVQAGSASSPTTIGSSDPLTNRVSRRTSICSGNNSPARNAAISKTAPMSKKVSVPSKVPLPACRTGHHNTADRANISAATTGKIWLPV